MYCAKFIRKIEKNGSAQTDVGKINKTVQSYLIIIYNIDEIVTYFSTLNLMPIKYSHFTQDLR